MMAWSSNRALDMTKGSILSNLFRFSLPLAFSSVLQLLYNAADVMVVGRFAGAQSLAAVGSTSALINLLTTLFVGLATGVNVLIAHANGAGDFSKISKATHTAVTLSLFVGVLVMLAGLFLSRPLLEIMGSPEDVIDLAALYLRIYFLGMPASMLYNFGANVVRAMGDTKSPLLYLSVSGIVNVLLNLLLVIVFKMGVAGVAIATVASQVLSAFFVIRHLFHSHTAIHLDLEKLCLVKEYVLEIIRIGLPVGIQNSLFSVTNVMLQSTVNAQGSLVMAGNAASQNLEGFISSFTSAFGGSILTFTSTNRGAKEYDRVRKGLWQCLGLVFVLALIIGMSVWAAGPFLLGLYNQDPEVIKWGMVRLSVMAPNYFLAGGLNVCSSQLRGVGYSVLPMVITLTGVCVLRILWLLVIFPLNPVMNMLYISYPITWLLTALAHLGCYLVFGLAKIRKEEAGIAMQG